MEPETSFINTEPRQSVKKKPPHSVMVFTAQLELAWMLAVNQPYAPEMIGVSESNIQNMLSRARHLKFPKESTMRSHLKALGFTIAQREKWRPPSGWRPHRKLRLNLAKMNMEDLEWSENKMLEVVERLRAREVRRAAAMIEMSQRRIDGRKLKAKPIIVESGAPEQPNEEQLPDFAEMVKHLGMVIKPKL